MLSTMLRNLLRCHGQMVAGMTVVVILWTAPIQAQGPLDVLRGSDSKNLARLPDDQIEGTVWEYKGTLKEDKRREPVEGKASAAATKLEGRFRFEENAVFDVGREIKLPGRDEVKGVLDSLRSGQSQRIKLPGGGEAKRIGNYKLSKDRLRIDLDHEESLLGTMVLRPKKNTTDVWQGTFQEKEGKRTIRTWQVEVRPVED